MSELLFELFGEEIPARLQSMAYSALEGSILQALKAQSITYGVVRPIVTPRRLGIAIEGLPSVKPASTIEKRGPRVGAPEVALEGFLRASNATREQLETRDVDGKNTFYFLTIEEPEAPLSKLFEMILPKALEQIPWPKTMQWGSHSMRWIRPVHSMLCVFDGAVVPFAFGHLQASSRSFGHRFLAPDAFEVKQFAEYERELRTRFVIANPEARKAEIVKQIAAIESENRLTLKPDDALLEEVNGLVEWPHVVLGAIESRFMSLPPEVLTSVMRTHQRYFALLDSAQKMAPYFVTVANIPVLKENTKVLEGNQRVLRARLEDARFYWEQDQKTPLEARVVSLGEIVFHAKLGSVAQKVERVAAIAVKLASAIGAQEQDVERAARLCKADLATGMVGEFPELQGIMGAYYARAAKESDAVAGAISDHYRPQGPSDFCPRAPVSVAVALSDKLDILVGMFAVHEKPTGSKDPYALRRAALGIIRLIVENRLSLPIVSALSYAAAAYRGQIAVPEETITEVKEFILERFKVQLKQEGYRDDVIKAVFAHALQDDLVPLKARIAATQAFLFESSDGARFLNVYRRVANILSAEEKKDRVTYAADAVNVPLLKESVEKEVYAFVNDSSALAASLSSQAFDSAFAHMLPELSRFETLLNDVTINDSDPALRKNRLCLLALSRNYFHLLADFSLIEG